MNGLCERRRLYKGLMLAAAILLPQSIAAQDNCLQRIVGAPPAPSVAHWVVTNSCGSIVQFRAYMTNGQGTYQVYTTELGKLVDPNPGLPISVRLNPGQKQSFYFSAPSIGTFNFITDNITQVH